MASNSASQQVNGEKVTWNPNANKLHKQSVPQTKPSTGGTTGPRGQV